MKLQAEVTIDAGVESVWSALLDDDRRTIWQSGLRAVEQLSGKPGEVGATSKWVLEGSGGNRSAIASLTEARRPDFAAFAVEDERSKTLVLYVLEKIDDRHTRWKLWTNTSFHGLLKLGALFRIGHMREKLDNDMQRFKLMVETDEASVDL